MLWRFIEDQPMVTLTMPSNVQEIEECAVASRGDTSWGDMVAVRDINTGRATVQVIKTYQHVNLHLLGVRASKFLSFDAHLPVVLVHLASNASGC